MTWDGQGSHDRAEGLFWQGHTAVSGQGEVLAASGCLSITVPWLWHTMCQHAAAHQQLDHTAAVTQREVCL